MRPPAGFGGCVRQDLLVGVYEEQIGIKSTPPQAWLVRFRRGNRKLG
jgi:hypothetical protein